MLLGRVVGTVWCTRKDPSLEEMKFLVVQALDLDGELTEAFVVAVDAVGAGLGERVLVAQGSSGRQTEITRDRPVDAVIMAIIDDWELDRREWGATLGLEGKRS